MKLLKITTLLITLMLFTLNSCKNPINNDEISPENQTNLKKYMMIMKLIMQLKYI
jgi:hypothetical protein